MKSWMLAAAVMLAGRSEGAPILAQLSASGAVIAEGTSEETATYRVAGTYYTLGPIRQGFINGSAVGSSSYFDGSAFSSVAIGPYSDFSDNQKNLILTLSDQPFTLGTQFQFDFHLFAYINPFGGVFASSIASGDAAFTLHEADGALVNVYLAPEPGTYLMLGTGLAVVMGLRRRSLHRKRT